MPSHLLPKDHSNFLLASKYTVMTSDTTTARLSSGAGSSSYYPWFPPPRDAVRRLLHGRRKEHATMSTRESEDSTLNRLIPEEAVDSENTTLAFALRATELGGAPITDGRLLFPPLVHDPQSLVAFSGGSSSDLQSWSSETLAQATDGVYIPEALTISDRGEFDVDDAGFEGLTDAVDSNVFELSVDSFLAGMSSGFSIVNGEERLEAGTSAQAIAGDGAVGCWISLRTPARPRPRRRRRAVSPFPCLPRRLLAPCRR